ncbi:hypothetical protein CDAR_483231 [Caerostris darwini]|uniref:Uncharacterized protein n=1 Tax=Caerostris darwini TaxID=1538125 RepID=A0AAV4V5Y2_9ARAC|nr:hypothetical protein CDAR_483231 [Caerostris darwini]
MPRSFLVKKVKHNVDHSNRWSYHDTSRVPDDPSTPPGFTIHYSNDKSECDFHPIYVPSWSITGELNKLISSDDTRFPKEVEKQSNRKWDSYLQKICSSGSRTF